MHASPANHHGGGGRRVQIAAWSTAARAFSLHSDVRPWKAPVAAVAHRGLESSEQIPRQRIYLLAPWQRHREDWRTAMGSLMLRCPMTDRNFSTGIHTDIDSLKLVPDTRITARCPYCGQEHTWGRVTRGWRRAVGRASELQSRDDTEDLGRTG